MPASFPAATWWRARSRTRGWTPSSPCAAAKYGDERGNVGNLLSDVPFGKFAEMLGGYGEEVRDPAKIAGALQRARESVQKTRKSAVINIWVDPSVYAPGTMAPTMYK